MKWHHRSKAQLRLEIPEGYTTIAAMALTAKEMNAKYKETSEGGLAVSLVFASSPRRRASKADQA